MSGGALIGANAADEYETVAGLPPSSQLYTIDRENLNHVVKDEILQLLEYSMQHSKIDFESNVFYSALGAGIGLFVPFCQSIWEFFRASSNFNIIDILGMCLFVASVLIAGLMLYICKTRPKNSRDIFKEIRDRTTLMLKQEKENESTQS